MDDQASHVAHHKSDFHRFNLKRKMINLPPVAIEQFNAKVAELQPKEQQQVSIIECTICKKEFRTENTYKAHTNSNKHKEKLAALQLSAEEKGQDPDAIVLKKTKQQPTVPATVPAAAAAKGEGDGSPSGVNEEKEEKKTMEELIEEKIRTSRKILLEECMFCLEKHPDLESNVQHMQQEHGFFIPDREYLKDLPGFIEYLGEKLSLGNICLWCNYRSPNFSSLRAVQAHMHALAHCKLAYEPDDEEEYSEFYDFGDNENAVIESTISAHTSTGFQIYFNDGHSIAHRSLQRYFRQRHRPSDQRAVVLANSAAAGAVGEVDKFKSAGWFRDAARQDKIRQSYESSMHQKRKDMELGVRDNFLFRYRKENVTVRNSGR